MSSSLRPCDNYYPRLRACHQMISSNELPAYTHASSSSPMYTQYHHQHPYLSIYPYYLILSILKRSVSTTTSLRPIACMLRRSVDTLGWSRRCPANGTCSAASRWDRPRVVADRIHLGMLDSLCLTLLLGPQ